MELFREDGCLSDEGLHALTVGQLDELGRLEAAEHLAYCDKCTDRYTALLTADALADPPRDVRRTVMSTIWVRLMQSTYGRAAVAGVAAVLALTMWRTGALTFVTDHGYDPAYGARPLRRYHQKNVETLAARIILEGNISEGQTIVIDTDEKGEKLIAYVE